MWMWMVMTTVAGMGMGIARRDVEVNPTAAQSGRGSTQRFSCR
jgi:hypothetical protein